MTSVEPDIESEALLETAANDAYQAIIEEEEDVDEANSSQDEDVIWLREQIENNKAISWINRPSVYILGLVICIFMIAFASTIGVKQIILFKLACNTVANSKGYCDPIETQVLVSSYEMYSMVGGTLVSLIPVAKAGELSDIYGRKPFSLPCLFRRQHLIYVHILYFIIIILSHLNYYWEHNGFLQYVEE